MSRETAHMIVEVSHLVGIIPLVTLAAFYVGGKRFPPSWWGVACAWGISYVADSIAHVEGGTARLVSQLYPVMQAGIAVVALKSKAIVPSMVVVGAVGVWSVLFRQGQGYDIALHLTAGIMVAGLAWERTRGWFRAAISTGFGGTALAWAMFVADQTEATAGLFQGLRLAAAVLFIVACWRDTPQWLEWA